MAYDRLSISVEEHSIGYRCAWIGLAANAVLLAAYLLPLDRGVTISAFSLTGAMITSTMFGNPYDDYYAALRKSAMRWGMGVVALYLFAGAFLFGFSDCAILRSCTASGPMPDLARGNPGFMADGFLLAIVAGLAYHIGFAIARLRRTSGQ